MQTWCAHKLTLLGYVPTKKQASQILHGPRSESEERILQDAWQVVLANDAELRRIWEGRARKYCVSGEVDPDYYPTALQTLLMLDGARNPAQWKNLFLLNLWPVISKASRWKYRGDVPTDQDAPMFAVASAEPSAIETAEVARFIQFAESAEDGPEYLRHMLDAETVADIARLRGITRQAMQARFEKLLRSYAFYRHRTQPAIPASNGVLGKLSA